MKKETSTFQKNSYIIMHLLGIAFGLIFPLSAWAIELISNGLSLTVYNIVLIHLKNVLYYISVLAPVVLGVFTYIIVIYWRKKDEMSAKLLELSKELESEIQERKKLNEQLSSILEKSPISYVVINTEGIITYVNPATAEVLGSKDTVHKNILLFSTVKNSKIEQSIYSAREGKVEKLQFYRHISATTDEEKYLNMIFLPINWNGLTEKNDVLMISRDMTNEIRLLNGIEESYINLTKGFAKALDAKDKYTSYHSSNVRFYTELILEEISLSKKEKQDIITAAELHDIGKIGVSDFILHKEGKLSDKEFEQMKQHPVIGANLFVDIQGYEDIRKFIKHHHERMDGKGYPDGLKAEEIPIGASIICVADAYDAMTTNRVYRSARSSETALQELIRCRGTQFRPEIVDILVEKIRRLNIEKNT